MGLTTIDGKLYIDYDTLNYLIAIERTKDADDMAYYQIHDVVRRTVGSGGQWPIGFLAQAMRLIGTRDMAHAQNPFGVQYGEEDLEGKVYGVDTGEEPEYINVSPIGGASIIGKVALELARRLEAEIEADRRQCGTVYQPITQEDVFQALPEDE